MEERETSSGVLRVDVRMHENVGSLGTANTELRQQHDTAMMQYIPAGHATVARTPHPTPVSNFSGIIAPSQTDQKMLLTALSALKRTGKRAASTPITFSYPRKRSLTVENPGM